MIHVGEMCVGYSVQCGYVRVRCVKFEGAGFLILRQLFVSLGGFDRGWLVVFFG